MTHKASRSLVWLLALQSFAAPSGLVLTGAVVASTFVAPHSAYAKDEEGRARSIDDFERQQASQQSEEFRLLAQQKRLESIDRLKGLITEAEGDRKAEMLLRLANLYFEQGRALNLHEMETFQKAYDACFATAADADSCDSIKPNNTESFGWFNKTIKLYEALLKGYPRYARADEATYYMGMTLREVQKPDEAKDAFTKLVKLYPQSSFIPDAFTLIGEYYFDRNEAFPALRAYLNASKYTESARWPYAMYKLAWSYYNVEEYGKAIDAMKAVVQHSIDAQTRGDASKIQLGEEALKDLVRFFADAGEMDEAYDYFTKLGRKNLIRAMLQRLAGLYFEQGKFDNSVETYRRLIMEQPNHPENPGYQQEIINCYRKMSQNDRVLDEIRRLRTDYGKQSAWYRANANDPDALASADASIEKALRTVADEFDEAARELQRSRHPRAAQAFEQAVDAYRVYLNDYGTTKNSYLVHNNFGVLLWDLKRYREAYDEFMAVVTMDPQGAKSRECAESAILSAEKVVIEENGGGDSILPKAGVTVSKDVQPLPLTEWEQKMISAAKLYADTYPGGSSVELAIYKTAFLLYNRYHFPEAAEQFRSVISRWPKSKNAEYAAHLILDALNIREEWVSLRDTAKSFYQQEGLGSAKFKTEMYTLWSQSAFTVIEKNFASTGDKYAAAQAYVQFYKDFPDFDKADFALNNAAIYYYDTNHVPQSMEIRHILVDDPKFGPKSQFYFDQTVALGYDYERLADLPNAIKYYDLAVSFYTDALKAQSSKAPRGAAPALSEADQAKFDNMANKSADALYSAAVFANALGQVDSAIAHYKQFLTLFPADARDTDIYIRIGSIYEDNNRWADAAKQFKTFYTTPELSAHDLVYEFYARLHYGLALEKQNDVHGMLASFEESVARYKRLKDTGTQDGGHTEFVAQMMMRLAQPALDRYIAQKITGAEASAPRAAQDKALKASLEAKTKALVELERTYTAIIQTGSGEWGLAALVALGKIYDNFGAALTSSPIPGYLTRDQADIYRMTLEDRAYVQTDKAVQAYSMALEKAYELHLYNDNTAYATRRLGEIEPENNLGLAEQIPQAGLVSNQVRTFKPETSIR